MLSSAHDLVDKEELLREDWRKVEELSFHAVVVPNVSDVGGDGLTRQDVYSHGLLGLLVGFLDGEQSFLDVVARVGGKRARDDEERLGEDVDSQLDFAGDVRLAVGL